MEESEVGRMIGIVGATKLREEREARRGRDRPEMKESKDDLRLSPLLAGPKAFVKEFRSESKECWVSDCAFCAISL